MLNTLDRPKTLKEGALQHIRDAITLGIFKPGERLVERSLCEQLGISRTVVRECIRHLESERLVSSAPNVGPSVAVLDNQEVAEIYEIRTLLEVAAVQSCAMQAAPETVKQLYTYCDGIAKSLKKNDVLEALRQTNAFYEVIFTTGNKRVSWDLVGRLNGRISRLRALTLSSEGRSVTGPENLLGIVRAIEKADPETATLTCRQHIAGAEKIAMQKLDQIQVG